LDVVYNHTYEGNELGPTLCYKGIDNPSYYKLNPENQRFYDNISGCGNTLNFETPEIAELAISSLKHFINQYNIDGFRFDLAPILARKHTGFAPNHYFFQLLSEDPAFDSIKLIAEPWDPGIGGYQLGNFPKNFMEWNDKYRDTVRRYWKGEAGLVDDIAYKITGSSDTFSDKYAFSSINFITCHDGFTLNDLVSYNHKHNELNGENNRDGTDANYSYNWGIEGKTSNRAIKKKRMQAAKNMLASLLLSQGIPMLQGGDELFRTKEGNNNSYLHDNKINWFNWNLLNKNKSIHKFVRYLIKLRKQNQIFRRKTFFTGENIKNTKDITWLKPNLKEFKHKNWHDNSLKSISYLLDSFLQVSNSFFIIMNADHKSHKWHLPKLQNQQYWNLLIDTSKPESIIEKTIKNPTYNVKPYSFILFQSKK
jgi:glycogen operon protein